MEGKTEVEHFLREFKEKMRITQVFFRDDRGKNAQTLADLELRPIDREKVLKDLKIEDYSDGPLEDVLNSESDLWIFGKEIKKKKSTLRSALDMAEEESYVFRFIYQSTR